MISLHLGHSIFCSIFFAILPSSFDSFSGLCKGSNPTSVGDSNSVLIITYGRDPFGTYYRCEKAKIYLGFSIQVTIKEIEDKNSNAAAATTTTTASTATTTMAAVIETTPQSYVRESVLDYVRLRRSRASANSVISNLIKYRNKVIVAPSGNYGCIVDVIARKAGSQLVSDTDKRNLVDSWKQIYGIDISPDEIPLLKVKMINSENVFTYPPSMCFFGNDSLFIPADVQKFVEYKKSTVKSRMDKVVNSLVNEEESLRIGDTKLEFEGCTSTAANNNTDIQVQLLHEVRQKLFGKSVMARGSAVGSCTQALSDSGVSRLCASSFWKSRA
jgi:hypothetical protein